jgi:hypothetical protein
LWLAYLVRVSPALSSRFHFRSALSG